MRFIVTNKGQEDIVVARHTAMREGEKNDAIVASEGSLAYNDPFPAASIRAGETEDDDEEQGKDRGKEGERREGKSIGVAVNIANIGTFALRAREDDELFDQATIINPGENKDVSKEGVLVIEEHTPDVDNPHKGA